ncbi:MAG: hypothetical protein SNJ64_03335, partial [Endomicrobiia bacterium]
MTKIRKQIFFHIAHIVRFIILHQFFFNLTYLFAQPNAVNNLVSVSGLENFPEGSIKLIWTYPGPENLPTGSKYFIQYSTFSGISWSTTSA